MNRKGFTLIELLVVLVLLAIVMGIGSYAITNIIKNSKERNYELLITHIKEASELYYQECKFANTGAIECDYTPTLGKLVQYGFLKGNAKQGGKLGDYTIVDPRDNTDISDCEIEISYDSGKIIVKGNTADEKCPSYDTENSNQE